MKLQPQTPLERNVTRWAKTQAQNYDGNTEAVLKDLFYGGCQSGLVGHLIYYKDTLAFYRRHQKEIDELVYTMLDELGENGPADLFGDKWDKADPLACETQNQNLLAWYGFEGAARRLADRAGLDC